MMRKLHRITVGLGAAMFLSTITLAVPSHVGADTVAVDFETFALGSPDGQEDWSALGSAGFGCALYDHQIESSGIVPFGTRSLRISNAVTSGCFSDQTFSKSLADEAGETAAANDGMSGGTRQQYFEAQWDFASAVPGAEQVGLQVVASPDRGDGARMSWIQMADAPAGIEVNFYDYRDEHAVGTSGNLAQGCASEDDFFLTNLASGLDRSLVHTIKVAISFRDGPRNDIVWVWVDGDLVHVDTTWEDYFRYCEAWDESRTVDSILFRTGGASAPGAGGAGFYIDNLSISSGPDTATDTDGTWLPYPEQTATSETATTTTVLYRTKVRPPINADGSSNFPKRRGVVPVQFDLESATRSIVETTTEVGPVVFDSLTSDGDPDNDYAFLRFTPDTPIAFAELDSLVADYDFTTGNCGGGALRWQVRVDVDNDGDESNDGSVFIYFGDVPNFDDCDGAANNTGNLIGSSDARFDLTQLGGPFYGTYADALVLAGGLEVLRASLVLDGGWLLDQQVALAGAEADGSTWEPLPEGTTTTVDSDTTTPYVKVCELPEAAIKWTKNDPHPTGTINETAESIQNGDSGEFYRRVDCKYIYNLEVGSLDPNLSTRQGTYYVYAKIDGIVLESPAQFDLR